MNWQHLRAVLWVRWRILSHRILRAGRLNNTILAAVIALVGLGCGAIFLVSLVLGGEIIRDARPFQVMMIWAVPTGLFLMFWLIGLTMDLQRADAMSMGHLMHLPISTSWVFLYNYLGSFVSASVFFCLPAMAGLSVGSVILLGPRMLWSLPLVGAFMVMVTALTFQLRGWLARLMEDKRRGRSIAAIVTLVVVLLLQAPSLIHLSRVGSDADAGDTAAAVGAADPGGPAAEPEPEEGTARERIEGTTTRVMGVVPFGWLPRGVRAAHQGRWLPALGCFVGMLSIGLWSLRRGFLAARAGALGAGGGARRGPSDREARRARSFVERSLPFVDEREAAIALTGLRSLLRSPEAKLVLIGPLVTLLMLWFALARGQGDGYAAAFAPLLTMAVGLIGVVCTLQLQNNMFGLDRDAVRAYLLSPVPRHRLLRGKNLAMAPLVLGIAAAGLCLLWWLTSLGPLHLLGAILQAGSMFLVACLIGNLVSILVPVRLRENSLKNRSVKLKPVFAQMLAMFLLPVLVSPLAIPAGVDYLLGARGWGLGGLVFFLLHAGALAGVAFVYARLIPHQGRLMERREMLLLEALTGD